MEGRERRSRQNKPGIGGLKKVYRGLSVQKFKNRKTWRVQQTSRGEKTKKKNEMMGL